MSLINKLLYISSVFVFLNFQAFAHTQNSEKNWKSLGGNGQLSSLLSLDNGDITSDISHDLTKLPAPVIEMREKIIKAAQSGDIEKLRPLLDIGEDGTQVSLVEVPKDPIALMKASSKDGQGLEVLAILLDILDAGYIHLDQGKDSEAYVWPYFVALPLDGLSQPQKVELLRLITAGDYESMKDINAYIFYRIGISPDGKWRFFVTGD